MTVSILILTIVWCIAVFVIFWAMIGYPVSLVILNKLFKKKTFETITKEYFVT